MRRSTILGSIFTVVLAAMSAHAATITYTLDTDACSGSGGCGAGPYGTITLVDNGSGTSAFVTVTETLASGERYAGTGAGDALEFNVTGPITITNITANFAIGPAPDTASAFGSFLASVTCSTCQGGQVGNPAGPLSFNVGSATGVTVSSFTANSGGFTFASDIFGNGNTGNVGVSGSGVVQSTTPEPATVVLTLAGLALLGGGSFRRRIRS